MKNLCGLQLSTRAANVLQDLLIEKKLLVLCEERYVLERPTPDEIAANLTLAELKQQRDCGRKCVAEITAALIAAKAKPSWTLERKLPRWVIRKCPCCGVKLYV